MNDVIKTFQKRGKILEIVRDTCPEHPLNMTDAPIHVGTWEPRHSIAPRGHDEGRPERKKGRTIVWFNVDDYDIYILSDCSSNATGAVWMDFDEEREYGGNSKLTMRLLRRFAMSAARDIEAWANGEVFGWIETKTFRRNGELYKSQSPDDSDSCWGYYGVKGLYTMDVSRCFVPNVHRLAREMGYKGR